MHKTFIYIFSFFNDCEVINFFIFARQIKRIVTNTNKYE